MSGVASVAALGRALAAGETTAVALTEGVLAGIARHDAQAHAFATVIREAALAAARAADMARARGVAGPLAGIPIAVKDNLAVQGVVRGNGSPACADDPPATDDAGAVARLRAAGAVIVGTTHMHELALGPTGVNPMLGTPTNPWASDRMPGGSSSGSGVAVAAGLVPAALGSDTGGSVRIPASFCGVTGLKPTYGRVSRSGCTALAWSLDHVGVLARTAEDLALILGAMAGIDPADPTSARLPVPNYVAALGRPLTGLRIGVPRAYVTSAVDAGVEAAFARALDDMRGAGVLVSDVTVPALAHAQAALAAVILPESGVALRALLGTRADRVGVETRVFLEIDKLVAAHHYLAGQRLRTRLYDELRDVFRHVDLLALPTTALPAQRLETLTVRLGDQETSVQQAIARLTGPFNLTGLPALALPCGFTGDGLPVSLQLVGRPFAEADVLAAGHAYQQLTDWHRRWPPGAPA